MVEGGRYLKKLLPRARIKRPSNLVAEMDTSPDLELRLGSLSIEEDESPEAAKIPLQADEPTQKKDGIDLNETPASTPAKAAPSQGPRVGLVYSEQMMLHAHPKGDHPEQPARVSSIFSELKRQKLVDR